MKVQQSFWFGLLRILILSISFAELLCPMIGGQVYSASFGTGEYILFERGGDTYRMNVDGSGVRLIVKLAESPVCSPNGDGIVFVRLERNPTGRDLFWTDPLGNSIRRLTRGLFISAPFSVSNNAIIAFVSGTIGTQELHTVRVIDGVAVKHANDSAEVRAAQWSPDGRYLGFAAAQGKGLEKKWAYYVLEYPSGAIKRIADSDYHYPSLSWSPDGRSVALVQIRAIEIIDLNTGTARRLPRDIGILHDVAWSPDGQYLAVTRDDETCHKFSGNIYVIRLSDNTETKVSNHWFRCRDYHSPRWSPDGTKVIFLAFRPKGDMDFNPFTKYIRDNIYIVNRDGSGQTNLSGNEDEQDRHPMWCKESVKN